MKEKERIAKGAGNEGVGNEGVVRVTLERQDSVTERLRESNGVCLRLDESEIVPGGPMLRVLCESGM